MDENTMVNIATRIVQEYKQYGYTQSVKNKILMFRSDKNFAELVAKLAYRDFDLFKKIIREKEIKFNYSQVTSFFNPIEFRLEWALRNGVKGMGFDEKRVLSDISFRQNIAWAFQQYTTSYHAVRFSAIYPNQKNPHEGKIQKIQRFPGSEQLTAREILEKELKEHPNVVEDIIDEQTFDDELIISPELVDIILANNPSESLLHTLLYRTYQRGKSRGDLLEKYAEIAESPDSVMNFLDSEKRRCSVASPSDYDSPADSIYLTYFNLFRTHIKAVDRAMEIAFGRDDYFAGAEDFEIHTELQKRVYHYTDVNAYVCGDALKALAKTAFKTLRERSLVKEKAELRKFLLYGNRNVVDIMTKAFIDIASTGHIDELLGVLSYNKEDVVQLFMSCYEDESQVESILQNFGRYEEKLNEKLLGIKEYLQEASQADEQD